MAFLISSFVSSSPAKNFSSSASSVSAALSIIFWRHSSACSLSSAGISPSITLRPLQLSSKRSAFMRMRSTTPSNASSLPIGITTGTGFPCRIVFTSSSAPKKSAPTRSILLTKMIFGTLYFSDWRQTCSDCGCTPATAQKSATAPSSTRSERSTSAVKSTCPGVSMIVIWWSRQKQVVAAEPIVMPRSCSWTMKSIVAAPSCTSPSLWFSPV